MHLDDKKVKGVKLLRVNLHLPFSTPSVKIEHHARSFPQIQLTRKRKKNELQARISIGKTIFLLIQVFKLYFWQKGMEVVSVGYQEKAYEGW